MKIKLYTTIILLLGTIIFSYGLPKPRYESPDIIGTLDIPHTMRDWRSKDMTKELNFQQDDRYKFISDILARLYGNRYGESMLFLIADVNNFHAPKVCFHSSGFQIQELKDTKIKLHNHEITATTIYAQKKDQNFVVLSWLVLDKNLTPSFVHGEMQQMFYNLLNKSRSNLMVRIDIPTSNGNIEGSLLLARKFLNDLEARLSLSDREYLFGKKNKY